jgi:predicted dehydrogenase
MSGAAGRPLRVGIVGAGMIAVAPHGFLPGLAKIRNRVEVAAICNRSIDRARAVAGRFGIAQIYGDLASMLDQCDIDAVINLTPISAHYEISLQILEAGKHLVSEKPLAATMAEADELCATAARRGLRIVAAPMDLLADEWFTARRLVANGALGRPCFARVQSSHGGPAMMGWPTDPSWFYQLGAGPLLDLGAYGLHRITGILGPVRRVSAFSAITSPVRHARGGAFDGREIRVEEPDNNLMLLDFGDGCFASLDATFNAVASRSPLVEIYGSEGTLLVHHETRSPALEVFRLDAAPGIDGWITPTQTGLPSRSDRTRELQRAVLVEHLADCLDSGTPPLLSAEHARHVLEVMIAARTSAETGRATAISSDFILPPAL